MRVETIELDGYRTCGRPRVVDSASWSDDTVLMDDCPGYVESEPVRILREEVILTFADNGASPTPGFDVNQVERSTVRYLPADGDWSCPHCGFDTSNFSPEPRTRFAQLSEQHPDELRRRSMRGEQREEKALSIEERQAAALEKLAAQAEENGRVAALEAEIAEMRELLAAQAKPTRTKAPAA